MNIIEQNMVKPNKIRTNYKHTDGCASYYKEINYNKKYYTEHKETIRCTFCNIPVFKGSMKRHLLIKRCLNNRCDLVFNGA
jgi:hypothetical protein